MTGVMGLLLIFERIGIRLRLLQWIGRNTMPIFLLHIIFAAGTRIVLLRIDAHEAWIHVAAGTVVGVLVPLFFSGMLRKVPGLLSAPWRQPSILATNAEKIRPRPKEVKP